MVPEVVAVPCNGVETTSTLDAVLPESASAMALPDEPYATVAETAPAIGGAIVNDDDADDPETLPAASVAVALTVCVPFPRATLENDQTPPVATAVPTAVPSIITVTLLPASAEPVIVGATAKTSPVTGVKTTGGAGAVASTVKLTALELGP